MVKIQSKSRAKAPVVLYVDDDPDTLELMVEEARRFWSPRSLGVRSLEGALRSLGDEDFWPDLVIHDCRPLRYDDDEMDSEEAGDKLYALFVDEELPVVVISGQSADEMLQREPYRSAPPISWLDKPLLRERQDDGTSRWRQLREAVEAYRAWLKERS